MLLNCCVGEVSWESLGLQGDPTSPFWRRSALGFLWKEWCWSWSWNSNTLATWWEELTQWERQPPKYLPLKISGEYFQENYKTSGTENILLKGLRADSFHLKNSSKTPNWKRTWTIGVCSLGCSVESNFLGLHDCSPPGSSVHGNLQARRLKWVAISSSRMDQK